MPCLFPFLVCTLAFGEGAEPGIAPWRSWKTADLFRVEVTQDAITSPDSKSPAKGVLFIVAQTKEKAGELLCWKLFMNPEKSLDPGWRFFVYVDDSGVVRKLMRYSVKELVDVDPLALAAKDYLGGHKAIFPLELPTTAKDAAGWTWTTRRVGPDLVAEGQARDGAGREIKVRQIWRPKEPWWRDYERHVDGKRQMTAKLLDPPPDPEPEAPKKPPTKKTKVDPQQLKEDWAKFKKASPQGFDKKLHARMTVVETRPKLAALLARLQETTGLKFTLADNIHGHDPDLGVLQLNDVGAYQILWVIADTQLVNGRWEKTEDGYRLTGTSLAGGAPKVSEPPVAQESRKSWWIGVAGGVLAATMVGAFWWRRRAVT